MITLTDAAIARVRNLQSQRATSAPLRLGIKQGGCSGLSYLMDFVDQLESDDNQYEYNGVQIVINNSNLPHNKYPTIIGDIINFFNLPELPTSKKTIFQVIRDHTNPFFVASQAYTS